MPIFFWGTWDLTHFLRRKCKIFDEFQIAIGSNIDVIMSQPNLVGGGDE